MVLISSGTDDAVSSVTNSSSLVFGIMGVGTFLLFFFFLVLVGVCIFSTPCATKSKVIARGVSVVLFIVVFLVLIFADRQSQFSSTGLEQQIYDNSVIPRVVLVIIMSVSALIAVVSLVGHTGESKKLSTIDIDDTALWQQ